MPVLAKLQVSNHITMRPLVALNFITRLDIEQRHFPGFVTSDDDVLPRREGANCSF